MPDANPLVDLVNEMRTFQALARETLTKIPLLVSQSSGDVTFNLGSPVVLPTFAKTRSELAGGDLPNRLKSIETISRGLVQEFDRLAAYVTIDEETGESATRSSPYWDSLDLSTGEASGLTNDPFYRAEVNRGIRLPFDGYTVRSVDRKFTSSSAKIGDWILPAYTDVVDNRYTAPPAASAFVNVYAYVIAGASRIETKVIRQVQYYRYYGYYYRWYYNYRRGWYSQPYRYSYYYQPYYIYNTLSTVVQANLALEGSMAAQSFQVSQARVLTGFKTLAVYVADHKAAAQPRLILCENSYGRPDMEKIITTATLVNDSEAAKATTNIANLTWNLARPVVLVPNKSYSFIVEAKGEFRVLFSANQDTTGGVFYTQDRANWDSDTAKDLAYSLIYCDFSDGLTTIYIDIPNIELSGGIASASEKMASEQSDGTTIVTQVQINGTWYDIGYLDTVNSLPPFTPARVKLTGTRYAYPIIDSVNSAITAFRPATTGRFISKDRTAAQTLTIAYELAGFNPELHTFDPGLVIGSTRYTPTSSIVAVSADGQIRTITATFAFPGSSVYRHDIRQATANASQTFDVNSVIKLNT